MAHADIRVGDIGTVFRLTIVDEVEDVINISSATEMTIRFGKPDDTTMDRTGSFVSGGTDGIIQYTTITDDIDMSGKWRIQAYIVTPLGAWRSEIETFWVKENLDPPVI